MRNAAHTDQIAGHALPLGWVILGLALTCWAVVIGIVMLASNIFSYILSV